MPNVTLYIRREDFDKWSKLKGKSAFVSKHLNELATNELNKQPSTEKAVPETPKVEFTRVYCEHAYAKDKCPKCNPNATN